MIRDAGEAGRVFLDREFPGRAFQRLDLRCRRPLCLPGGGLQLWPLRAPREDRRLPRFTAGTIGCSAVGRLPRGSQLQTLQSEPRLCVPLEKGMCWVSLLRIAPRGGCAQADSSSFSPRLGSDILDGVCCWGSVSSRSLGSKRVKGPELAAC